VILKSIRLIIDETMGQIEDHLSLSYIVSRSSWAEEWPGCCVVLRPLLYNCDDYDGVIVVVG
jgi:hypothetical protein